MAEVMEPREVSYPTVLYFQHSDGRMLSQTFNDPVSYGAARTAGWHSSPASFGVETHPAQPGIARSQEVLAPVSLSSIDLAEVTALILALQIQMERTAQAVRALGDRVTHLEAQATAPAHPPQVARVSSSPSKDPDSREDDKPVVHPLRRT